MPDYVPVFLSAGSPAELRELSASMAAAVDSLSGTESTDRELVRDLAARSSLAAPRPYRAVVIASGIGELRDGLGRIGKEQDLGTTSLRIDHVASAHVRGDPEILFLFPGQGSQTLGETSEVAALSGAYAARVAELERRYGDPDVPGFLSRYWADRVVDERADSAPKLSDTAIAQPMLTIVAIAMTDLLVEMGVRPTAALGHSVGEFGALYAANLISYDDALKIIGSRVQCMAGQAPGTGMAAVFGDRALVEEVLSGQAGVYLACDNGPGQLVIGGTRDALAECHRELDRRHIRSVLLRSAGAFHTPHFAVADESFRNDLAKMELAARHDASGTRCISSVSGLVVPNQETAVTLISGQVSSPVLFHQALETASQPAPAVVVQVCGGNSLIRLFKDVAPDYVGAEVSFGGQHASGTGAAMSVGELFLTVESIRPEVLFGRVGVASRWRMPHGRRESVCVGHAASTASQRIPDPRVKRWPSADNGDAPVTDYSHELTQNVPALQSHAIQERLIGLFEAQVEAISRSLGSHALSSLAPLASIGGEIQAVSAAGGLDRAVSVAGGIAGAAADETRRRASAPELAVVRDEIIRIAARIGGYSPSDLSDGMLLGAELGFDSLMMTNIAGALSSSFPDWRPGEVEVASLRTLGDLVASISRSAAPGQTAPRGSDHVCEAADDGGQRREPAVTSTSADRGEDWTAIEELPEVTETTARIDAAGLSPERFPYYLEHAGVIGATTAIRGSEYVSFSSYNYLGLTSHPSVRNAAADALTRFGTSVSAARILSGNRPIHTELEQAIAELVGAQDAVVLVGGHATNMSIIPHIYGKDDIVFHDALAHDSIQQGIKASGATRHAFPHNDVVQLVKALEARRHQFRRALIVTEGIFSMDGDIADLGGLVQAARTFGAHLMVDEAHSIGVLGRAGGGICEELGIDPGDVDILMGTLSKSLASCGGYIAGKTKLIRHLRYTLSGLIFSAGMTPPNTASALAALAVMRSEPERLARLRQNAVYFLEGAKQRRLNVGSAVGVPVVPVITGDSDAAIALADKLFAEGISVNPIVFPAVANELARLRFFITAEHTRDQLDRALDATRTALESFGLAESRTRD